MYFIRPVGEPEATGIDPELCERKILRNAAATVDLYRPVDYLESHLRDDGFYHSDLATRCFVPCGIHHPCSFQYKKACLIDGAAGLGDPLPNDSLISDWLSKSDPSLGLFTHHLKSTLGHADQAHAMMNPPGPEPSLRDLKTSALAEQNIFFRNADVIEENFRMSIRCIVKTKYIQHPLHGHAGRVHRDEDHRLLQVLRRRRIGLTHKYRDLASSVARSGRPPFPTI